MSHFELDLAERASVAVTFEAVSSLVDFYANCDDIGFSPALVLGRDIRRQLGERDGFEVWRELMWQHESPLSEDELLPGDTRTTITAEQFDAALVEEWRGYGEGEMHWTEMLLVDAMARAREKGWKIGNEVFALDDAPAVSAATEAILDDLAARSGAKRAAVEAVEKAASERRDVRRWKFFDLDDAAYDAWLDAGAPDGRGLKFARWKERKAAEDAAIARFDARMAQPPAPGIMPPMPRNVTPLHSVPAPPAQSRTLPLTFFGECRNRPRLRYHIRGLLAEGATSTLYGLPKTNKSTAAVDVCVHLAAGRPDWRGYRIREARGVVYFAFERARQVEKSLEAYEVRDGLKDLPFAVCGRLINMLDPACVDVIVDTIKEAEKRFGIPAGVAVFDTWNKGIAAGGGNEDKAEYQNLAAANLRRIIEAIPNLHCMTIGHTGKDVTKGERGSNATQGDRDVGILIEKADSLRKVTVAYANDLPEGDLTSFACEAVEIGKDDEGNPETGYIVSRRVVAVPSTNKTGHRLANSELNALRALGDVLKTKGKTRKEVGGGRSVTLDEWREHMFQTGAIAADATNPRKDFQRAREGLLAKDRIFIQETFVRIVGIVPVAIASP
jgi:AAA domain